MAGLGLFPPKKCLLAFFGGAFTLNKKPQATITEAKGPRHVLTNARSHIHAGNYFWATQRGFDGATLYALYKTLVIS